MGTFPWLPGAHLHVDTACVEPDAAQGPALITLNKRFAAMDTSREIVVARAGRVFRAQYQSSRYSGWYEVARGASRR